MKKWKLLQVLSLSMMLLFVMVSNASAASVLFWDNYYSSPFWDTSVWLSEVQSKMSQAGYTPTESYRASASQMETNMRGSYGLYEYTGHGLPGGFKLSDGESYWLYAEGAWYDIKDDISVGTTTGKTFWLLGCSQALTDSWYGHIPTQILAKANSACKVYAVDRDYLTSTAQGWNNNAWTYLASGHSLDYSIRQGFSDIYDYNNPVLHIYAK